MKRDCDKEHDLIPIKYQVMFCKGQNDHESVKTFTELQQALDYFDVIESELTEINCSDVRLYAVDKQRYANCIKVFLHRFDGSIYKSDRTNELKGI